MGQEHTLRILHISDLHARGFREPAPWRRRRVLGPSWEQNLDALCEDGPFDLVCMTGDQAFSGDASEYAEVTDFLAALLDRLSMQRDRLFLVPGNHDVHRGTEVDAWRELRGHIDHHDAAAFSQWLAGGRPPRGIGDGLRDAVLRRQAAYRDWLEHTLQRGELLPARSPHQRLGYRATLRLLGRPFDIHVLGLDSAWLAGDDADSRNLWLTEDQVMRLATDDQGNALSGFRLALIHHPLTDLADGEHCRRLLAGSVAGTGPLVDLLLRGHLHETEHETWADPERTLRLLAAGCLYESDRHRNACVAITVRLDDAGRPLRHELRFRGWSHRGHWFDDNSLYANTKDGRLVWPTAQPSRDARGARAAAPLVSDGDDEFLKFLADAVADVIRESNPAPRVFVGRQAELAELERVVGRGPVMVCAVQGMPGVGKSYLVDHFAALHDSLFPGGYERLVLEPDDTRTAEELRDSLRDMLIEANWHLSTSLAVSAMRLTPRPATLSTSGLDAWNALAQQLRAPRTLVHIENVDSAELASVVAEIVRRLDGCPLVVTGRFRDLGRAAGWARLELTSFEEGMALAQLDAELKRTAQDDAEAGARRELVQALGGLPLATHLAAGYLAAGHSAAGFLRKLRSQGLALSPRDPADPMLSQGRARAILRSTFEISLGLLRGTLARSRKAEILMAGLAALGHAPAAGVGASLGAAIAGLAAEDYEDLVVEARALSLLEDVPHRGYLRAVRMHPLLAELMREDAPQDDVVARMTEWFIERLPPHEHEQGRRWGEIRAERAGLVAWLAVISTADCARIERAGTQYARQCGPYLDWAAFCERCVQVAESDEDRSHALWTLGVVATRAGDLDRALVAAQDKARLDQARGAEREATLARGQIADVLQARGELEEALRIYCEELLPVYERLGDEKERAVTKGRIADVLQVRGELEEALRIYREELLPVYERFGDEKERAVTMGRIADVLQARGELDQALRIYREELLPLYESLGHLSGRAMTKGRIADVLQARGELDEALWIYREELLSVYLQLGDARGQAMTKGRIADVLEARGDLDEAVRLRSEEELPVFERLGARIDLAVARTRLALLHLHRQGAGDHERAAELLRLALTDARAMQIAESDEILAIMQDHGIDE
jgi:tetratricopeptide (TPR) repeat protein/predicted MPP superfamily phosphohydrolase